MDKQAIKKEIADTERLIKAAQRTLEAHVRSVPCIMKTRYVRLQVSYDVFRVKTHNEAKELIKKLNDECYSGHNDWRLPFISDCYLLKEAAFNWYECSKNEDFIVGDTSEKAFCNDYTFGWISAQYAHSTKTYRVFAVREVKEN